MAGTDYMAAGMNAGLARGKQDLLLHLLANLPHSILLLGAQGSGKTALLRQLQGRVHENWRACALQGGANLSFERVIEEMLVSLPRATSTAGNAEERLDEQLSQLGKQGGRLVLLLDDAGLLMPGLLAAICQFVRLHPEIRLVFSLRPEELAAKSATDALALADAHRMSLDESAEPPPAPPRAPPIAQTARVEVQNISLALAALAGKPLYWLIGGGLIAAVVSGAWVGSRWQASPPTTTANPPAPLSPPATAAPTPVLTTPAPSPMASPLAAAVVPPSAPPQSAAENPAEPLPTPTLAPSPTASPTPTAEPTPAASPVPTAKPLKKKPAPPRPSEAPKRASEAAQAREAKKTESKPAAKPKPSPAPKPQDEKPVSLRKLLDEMDKP